MQCVKCVLPEHNPDIWLNEEGICNVCLDFQKAEKLEAAKPLLLESELVKTLNKYRGKGKYDCLVMCSGGKDSTFALYHMKKRYKMHPLAFTFDHGFENEESLKNVRNAVRILEVDWLYYKSDFMQDFFTEIINMKGKASICSICSIWYMQISYDFAIRFKIPLIISGWTKGQMRGVSRGANLAVDSEFALMSKNTQRFIDKIRKKYPKYKKFPKTMKEVQTRYKIPVLSPHWFLQGDLEASNSLILKELKWELPKISYPAKSANCYLNFLAVYLSLKYYGFTHYHIEMSRLIRKGELSRNEALKALEIDFKSESVLSILSSVVKKLGYQMEDLPC